MNRTRGMFFPVFLAALFVLCLEPSSLHGESTQYVEAPSRTYSIGQAGTMQSLGIEVQATPEVSKEGGVAGFLIQLTYKDPVYPASETVVFLRPTIFPASCVPTARSKVHGPYKWHNSRGVGFAVTLRQDCKDAHLGIPVPFMAASVWCSDIAKELHYIAVLTSKRLFHFAATGYQQTVQNDVGRTLEFGKLIYNLVSIVLVVVDVVAFSRGTLTAGRFVMKQVVGAVQDHAVDSFFDYAQREYGSEVRFVHTGWDVTCRLCGTNFHRKVLNDGDWVRCPKNGCVAAARVIFRTNP